MNRSVAILSCAVLLTASALSGGAAQAAPRDVAAARTSATTVTAQRTAAFRTADLYAAQAPRLTWQQKARNADRVAASLQLPGLGARSKVVAIGKTQLGTQYRWGGTTPAGFDCSGFTKFSYGKARVSLPRTAAQQQRATKATNNPMPGDLVFFGSPAYHVGIYVGEGQMLHSPRTGKPVQIADIYRGASYRRL